MIKIPTKCAKLHTAGDGIKYALNIPQTPRVSIPVEIKQLTLPPVTPVRIKGVFRMSNDSSCGSGHQVDQSGGIQARTGHLVSQFRHKLVFPAPESTQTSTPPGMFVAGPEKPRSFTLSVPSRPKSMQQISCGSQSEVFSNHTSAKNSSVYGSIDTSVQAIQGPNYAMSNNLSENFAANTDPNETFAMNTSPSGKCMDTANPGPTENYTDELQSATTQCSSNMLHSDFSSSLHGSWFDTWGIESNAAHSDQQVLFSHPVGTLV